MTMNGNVLVDTNAIIAVFARHPVVTQLLLDAARVYAPVVSLGELYFGARKSSQVEANIAQIERYVSTSNLLNCDIETARHYGRIRAELMARGRPIPENDTWIAALAMQHQLTLVSRDAHFTEIAGLIIQSWEQESN